MAQINLLPWREELRTEKKKEFLIQLAIACCAAAVVCLVWVKSVENTIANQNSRNNTLKAEIKILEKKVEEIKELKRKRKALIDRMTVIQDLEGKRAIIVHYFDAFAKAIPNGIYVTDLTRRGDVFSIEGVSESNNRISEFMRLLNDSDWFADPFYKGQSAATELGAQAARFSLDVKTVIPGTGDESEKTNG